ncbi:hypothetical protein [Kozakia baliensis]|uniref:Uncharacterized protein n=1 Tax=Kozakia baliensis TaxID=153496 RepID=A0A1D8UUZ7_9PROT|nr:hypothetical protein [Kozakia baliensis]AOX17469.1 hypothetical protein A0U89_10320 [Kozakia baliensis]GBR30622.1 alcohol dehydrogenase 15 kDa subunit [Kozakia baliensis NRIC 0488]GEL63071.1 hypothetical protein KBA01_03570 [Kozakia baliensis]
MFRRIAPALGLALGLGVAANAAHALPPASPPQIGVGTKDLSGISGANLAGLLNYCIEQYYVSYDEANPLLDQLIKKYDAVDMQGGSFDYANGTAGRMKRNGTDYDIAALSVNDRKATCQIAVKTAQPML